MPGVIRRPCRSRHRGLVTARQLVDSASPGPANRRICDHLRHDDGIEEHGALHAGVSSSNASDLDPVMKKIILLLSHISIGLIGFLAGIYLLPILTAPTAPDDARVQATIEQAQFQGVFRRELRGSDALHWGEGEVAVGPDVVSLRGKIAPGPDYKLYLSPRFVETEAEFLRAKNQMVRVGDVKTFNNFVVALPTSVDPSAFNTVIVWCEAFGEFITAAQYR
jgi:hypothetical protein